MGKSKLAFSAFKCQEVISAFDVPRVFPARKLLWKGDAVAYYVVFGNVISVSGTVRGCLLFSPGQNGKSHVFSETPIERIGEGKR